jgi:hypothetical protein
MENLYFFNFRKGFVLNKFWKIILCLFVKFSRFFLIYYFFNLSYILNFWIELNYLMIAYIALFVSLNYILRGEAATYYLRTDGTDSTECKTPESPCKTIDYVVRSIVNVTAESLVYVYPGTYNCTLPIGDTNGFADRTYSLIGYLSSSSSINPDDYTTYPVLLFDANNANTALYFRTNVNASFQYFVFYIGPNCNQARRLIMSFVCLFVIIFSFFFFQFVYLLINKTSIL